MFKNSILYTIFGNKCPRCRKGDFFIHSNPFSPIRGFDKMHTKCSHCDQNLTPEPAFYYGAMYISYAYYVGIILVTALLGLGLLDIDLKTHLTIMIPLLIILTPIIFRISRRTWLAIFVSYDANAAKEPAQK